MHRFFDERRYLIPFRSALLPQIFTDVLVIGSGVAGASAALRAAEHSDVIMLAKGPLMESNTALAQGGIAAVLDKDDSVDAHAADTLTAGAGLCDEPVVRRIVADGARCIDELVRRGMIFDRDEQGHILLGREGGHHVFRIAHADGDATGHALAATLLTAARAADRIRLFDQCFVLDLLSENGPGSRCLGAITHHPKYGLQVIWSKATILATGGCGRVYRETTNSPIATGDGMAAAYRAGATLADMEFMQFHPTTLYIAGATRALISEAVRGEGAFLVDRHGARFMKDVHELADLAPRDIVARAIQRQMAVTNTTHVYLDCRHIRTFAERFPGITTLLRQFELDPGRDLVPVRPAAHYMIGGVWADEEGATNVPGLYACGEASCTGLHGANRLASNSLLEGLVCGRTAGSACRRMVEQPVTLPIKVVSDIRPSDRSELDVDDVARTFRSVMWRHVGIEREGDRLAEVAEMFDFWARYTLDKIFDDRTGWEVQNQLLVGAMITRAARWRTESRGTHYRLDHLESNDAFRVHACWRHGRTEPELRPVREGAAETAAAAAP